MDTAERESTQYAPLPPMSQGHFLLGNMQEMISDLFTFILGEYHKMGPIFRIRALHQVFTIMAGKEANAFLAQTKDRYVTTNKVFDAFNKGLNTDQSIMCLDGAEHLRIRKVLGGGYSKQVALIHLQTLVDITKKTIETWESGKTIPVVPLMKELITKQLGLILNNHAPDAYLDEIQYVFNILLDIVTSRRTSLSLYTPRFLYAKARLRRLLHEVLEKHESALDKKGDMVDDLLAAQGQDGSPLPTHAIHALILGSYLAGDVASFAAGFVLYALVTVPNLLCQVQQEVRREWKEETLTFDSLYRMEKLHATILESLRRYPAAPMNFRMAKKTFEFKGYRVKKGSKVIVASGVTQMLPEYFEEPYEFRIDRYMKPNAQHRQTGIYCPFGLGPHTCLGSGMAEIQITAIVATLLKFTNIELYPRDYQLKIAARSTRGPDNSFCIRVQ